MRKLSLVSLLSMSAALNLAAASVSLNANTEWKSVDTEGIKTYAIDYDGKGWPGFFPQVDTGPGEFYKVRWMMKSQRTGDEPQTLAIEGSLGKGTLNCPVSKEWNTYSAYVFSGNGGPFKFRIYLNPGSAGKVEAKNVEVSKVSTEELSGNLLSDGDFEHSAGSPVDWLKDGRVKGSPISIVRSEDFISGERSMAVEFKPQDGNAIGIQSPQLPVEPGKVYEFNFWAKAGREFVINVDTQAWPPYGHKGTHFWKRDTFKITTEWKQYSLKASIPSDLVQYPDLAAKTVYIGISAAAKDQEEKVLFDDMSFKRL